MNRRPVITVAAALLLVATTACSADEAPESPSPVASDVAPSQPDATTTPPLASSEPSPSSTTAASEPLGQADDDLFLDLLRSTPTGAGDLSDEEILALAQGTCERLNAGESFAGLTLELAQSGQSEEQSAVSVNVMVAGMVNFCPDRYAEVYPQ